MLSPRAQADHVPVVVPDVVVRRHALVPALLLALLLSVAGCGSSSDEEAKADKPSKDTVECREKWKALEDKVGDRASKTEPSALAPRWNSVAATISYYANGAKASDCDTAYTAQQKAMVDLIAFGAKLRPYDMEVRLKQVKAAAEKYAAGPRPKPSPAPKNKKQKQKKPAQQPPKPASIGAAVKALTKQAPIATEQQGAGWQQARVVDLADKAAVAKTLKDLKFLSTESAGYKASQKALAEIRTALPYAAY